MSILSQSILSQIKSYKMEWDNFWFNPMDLYHVSLFRCILGLSMLVFYSIRFESFNFYFSENGILPVQYAAELIPEGYRSLLPFYFKAQSTFYVQACVHLFLTALFAFGVFGRSLTWLLFILNLGMMQRNMTIIYGADLFCSFWLFYLSFINHNCYFSILNFFKKGRALDKARLGDTVSTMGIRLIQIQLCLSYAYTGIEKLKGLSWWEGSAVWYVIGMEEFIPHDFAFLKHFPLVIALLSMTTLIFEVYFIFAVWNKRLRGPWLLIGFLFHLGTAVFMNLWFFCLVVVSAYCVFLTKRCLSIFGSALALSRLY